MKKIVLSLLIILSIFTIVGCNKNTSSGKNYSLGDTVKTNSC